jgi:hypothetical protein
MQPFDHQYLGQAAMVSARFNRFRNDLYLEMMSLPNPFGTPGLNPGGDLGTYLIQEGFAFPIWIQQPYASAKAAMSGLEAGLHYGAAFMLGPDEKTPGMGQHEANCIFFCTPINTMDTNNTVKSILYDFSVSGLPTPA